MQTGRPQRRQAWKLEAEEVNRSDLLFGKWVFDLAMA
jgi:hypothetical protein